MMPRRRWIMALGALAGGWVVFELIWVATGTPAPDVDYQARLEQLTASYQALIDSLEYYLVERKQIQHPSEIAARN